jgi:hypothetical protein
MTTSGDLAGCVDVSEADGAEYGEREVQGIGAGEPDYLKRATVELLGLGANLPEDAVYPLAYADGDGNPFTGANRYVWHMEQHDLPPVNAFWSPTLYDAEGSKSPTS